MYQVNENEYVIVDLQSAAKVVITNDGWHPFFSPDDKYFSVGGKFYMSQTGEEIANPFPFEIQRGLGYSDTCEVKINGNLIAIQQGTGHSPIEIWDYDSRKILASIDDWFVVRNTNFAFTKDSLILHTDYGAVSIYNCKKVM